MILPRPILSAFHVSLLTHVVTAASNSSDCPTDSSLETRDFEPQPDKDCEKCFHIINLFSYDQEVAIKCHANIRGGKENAQDNFVQFYLDDPGQPQNAGALIHWDPNFEAPGPEEKAPIGQKQTLEGDTSEDAVLKSWDGPGNFSVIVTHSFKDSDSGEQRVRRGELSITPDSQLGENKKYDCQKGSCRFQGPPYLWYPVYYCECYPDEADKDECCKNSKFNDVEANKGWYPKPPEDKGIRRM